MVHEALAAFIGALVAVIMMKEFSGVAGKLKQYAVAFLAGLVVTIAVAWLVGWLATHVFPQIH
jgi:hypothetical protein